MIAFKCACGHAGKAESGVPKTCTKCGAVVTLGALVEGVKKPLTSDVAKKAVLRYLGQGPDAPLLTPRQLQDRRHAVRAALDSMKVSKVADVAERDLPRLLDALEIRP